MVAYWSTIWRGLEVVAVVSYVVPYTTPDTCMLVLIMSHFGASHQFRLRASVVESYLKYCSRNSLLVYLTCGVGEGRA
jgi:hypothetical protein